MKLKEILKQLEELKLESPYYITLINQMPKYLKLKNSINNEFKKLYPNIKEKSLVAKIFAIRNPEISIICPYTQKKKKYNYSQKRYVCPNTCQCTKDYTIERCMTKHGVTSTNKLAVTKENKKNAYIRLWGVDNPSKVPEIQEQKKITSIKNWGCEFPLQSEEIKEKGRKTNLSIRGVEYGMQDSVIREKARKTNLKIRGVEYPSQDKSVKDKIKQTNLKNWNYENTSKSPPIKQKKIETSLRNFNREYGTQRHLTLEAIDIINDKEKFAKVLLKYGSSGAVGILGINQSSISRIHSKYGLAILKNRYSSYENEIETWLNDNNIDYLRNDRIQIGPKELDFYFPRHNVAVEFQGDYWHMNPSLYEADDLYSQTNKQAKDICKYDQDKFNKCKSNGIKLIIIWESQWEDNKEQIKENILAILKEKEL